MHKPLSKRQQKMLLYIDIYTERKNYPPSILEIGQAVELKSTSTVKGHLDRLRARGYVTWEEGKPRTLRLIHKIEIV